jgi:hypothetical protein
MTTSSQADKPGVECRAMRAGCAGGGAAAADRALRAAPGGLRAVRGHRRPGPPAAGAAALAACPAASSRAELMRTAMMILAAMCRHRSGQMMEMLSLQTRVRV